MALNAALVAVLSVLLGLGASLRYDTPPGPAIVTAALVAFLGGLTIRAVRSVTGRERS